MLLITIAIVIVLSVLFVDDSIGGTVAEQKCKDYGQYVYAEEYSPTLHISNNKDTVSKCGIVEVPLILGGIKASANEFPHMAVIGFGQDAKEKQLAWDCGGTLISEQFILTAAHCMVHRDKGPAQRVRLGTTNLKMTTNHVQEITVAEKIPHSLYNVKSKYNDIALLKLVQQVIFNEYVRPACINTDTQLHWTRSLATGFGKMTYDATTGTSELMKVQLSNIPTSVCHDVYKSNRAMPEGVIPSQFCAGEMAGKKDTCQGDSGGPLQTVLDKPYCMYNIIGITSFGKFCGFENSPGIYTNVAYYTEWIEEIVWK